MHCNHRNVAVRTWVEDDAIHRQDVCLACGARSLPTTVSDQELTAGIQDILDVYHAEKELADYYENGGVSLDEMMAELETKH